MLALLCVLTAAAEKKSDGAVLIRVGGEVVSAAGGIQAQAPLPNTHRTISLDLHEADIHNVLRLFAEVSGLNFVASDEVKGKVTVYMKDVPWDQALAVILHSKGLGAQLHGVNILSVDVRGE